MASSPVWTNYASMLSSPADFPIFSAFTDALYLLSIGSQEPLDPHQSHRCKG